MAEHSKNSQMFLRLAAVRQYMSLCGGFKEGEGDGMAHEFSNAHCLSFPLHSHPLPRRPHLSGCGRRKSVV